MFLELATPGGGVCVEYIIIEEFRLAIHGSLWLL